MNNGLKQLLYTWAPRGPTGNAGWQILGASEDLNTSDVKTILAFCSLPQLAYVDSNFDRVSFGWWDTPSNTRIVFNRVPRPLDGVPNNYVAHFLVGAKSDLPARQVVCLVGSTFWCDGSEPDFRTKRSGNLRSVHLSEIRIGQFSSPSQSTTQNILALLLSAAKDGGIALRLPPSLTAGVLQQIGNVLPELLDNQTLSTIWSANDPLCSIVGIGENDPAPSGFVVYPDTLISPELNAITASTFSSNTELIRAVNAARLSAVRVGPDGFHRRQYCSILLSLLALEDGTSDPAWILRALESPEGAHFVIEHPKGGKFVVDALMRMDEQAVDPLRRSCLSDSSIIQIVASKLWEHVCASGGATEFAAALRASAAVSIALETEFVIRALREDDRTARYVEALAPDEAIRLLLVSDNHDVGYGSRAAILSTPKRQEAIALTKTLSIPTRAVALAAGLEGKSVGIRVAAQLLSTDGDLSRSTAKLISDREALCEVLRTIRMQEVVTRTALAFVEGLGWTRSLEVAWCANEMITSQTRSTFFCCLPLTRTILETDDGWDQLLSRGLQLEIDEARLANRDSVRPADEIASLARRSRGTRASVWAAALGPELQVSRVLTGRGQRMLSDELLAKADRLNDLAPVQRVPCALLMLNVGLNRGLGYDGLAILLTTLTVPLQCRVEDACRWLVSNSEPWQSKNGTRWTSTIVRSVIVLIAHNWLSLRNSKLTHAGLQRALEVAARRMSGSERDICESFAGEQGKLVQKWWRKTA
jgi:hypothetical protein